MTRKVKSPNSDIHIQYRQFTLMGHRNENFAPAIHSQQFQIRYSYKIVCAYEKIFKFGTSFPSLSVIFVSR